MLAVVSLLEMSVLISILTFDVSQTLFCGGGSVLVHQGSEDCVMFTSTGCVWSCSDVHEVKNKGASFDCLVIEVDGEGLRLAVFRLSSLVWLPLFDEDCTFSNPIG